MLTRKTTKTTMLLAAGAITLGAVACDRTTSDNATNANPNPNVNSPITNAPTGPVTVTGANMASDPLANVENKDRVKEYPDETKISPPKQGQLITGFSVQLRESPRGESVTSLEIAQPVREVARDARGDYYLIVYADPKDPNKELAGWVYKDALENNGWSSENTVGATGSANAKTGNVASTTQKLNCAHGEAHLRTGMDFCAKTCKDDSSCDKSAGETCDGLAFQVQESNGKLSNVNYCVSSASKTSEPRGTQTNKNMR